MNFWIALGAGYFADEGLEVHPISPPRPDRSGRFLMMGRGDVAILPGPKQIELIAAEEPIAIFANLVANDPINLILRKEVAERLNVPPTAPLKERLESLKGLKIGVAPGPVTRLRVLFESVGLDADQHIEMVIVGGGQQNQAFGDGTVDALYAHTPYMETALVRQEGVEFVDQAGGEVPELADRQIHVMLATREYVEQNPEKVEKLTRAIYRAQQLAHSDVERHTLTMRMSMRRFTRLTNTFSKKMANHEAAIALHFMWYNFGRVHGTIKTTPANAAGVDSHRWTLREIAELAESN